jgi:hypothetical protein
VKDSTRRRFLRTGGVVGIAGLTGCSQITGGNDIKDTDGDGVIDSEDYAPRDPDVQDAEDVEEAGSDEQSEDGKQNEKGEQSEDSDSSKQFSYEFTETFDSLREAGWSFGSTIDISNSHLRGTSDDRGRQDFAVHPSQNYGEWEFANVVNESNRKGIRFIFTEDSVDPENPGRITGYYLIIQQKDVGGVLFMRKDDRDKVRLYESDFTHGGKSHTYHVQMPDSKTFELRMDGEQIASITDENYDIQNLAIRFDGAGLRVDRVSYNPNP